MDVSILDSHSERCRAALAGEMDIYAAAALKEQIDHLLSGHRELEIDLGGVSAVDSAGLQLLLATRRRAGQSLRFTNHSKPVLEMLELSNLAGALGDPLPLCSPANVRT